MQPLGVGAVIALGTVTACGKSNESTSPSAGATNTTSSSVVAMPQTATFIGKMPAREGQPQMVVAVSVDGDRVAAYACDNANDEAWFFGIQKNGAMELTSNYQDTLQASFDGKSLNTTLTMNDVTYTGAADPAQPPAGIYTATAGDARASWIVLPDQSMVGVTSANSKNDREVIDQINAQQADFKSKVRQARLNRQLQQSAQLAYGKWTSQLNGTAVTAVDVTGSMTSPPTSG